MKILIADDESIIRMGIKAMLQEMGHHVFAATNGRERRCKWPVVMIQTWQFWI